MHIADNNSLRNQGVILAKSSRGSNLQFNVNTHKIQESIYLFT